MKVAHHFSGGSGFMERTRPARDDRALLANPESIGCRNLIILSSLWDGPVLSHTNPALKCWATFTESLRDDSLCIRNKGFSGMGYSPDPPRFL
jgi:hypothetical protein